MSALLFVATMIVGTIMYFSGHHVLSFVQLAISLSFIFGCKRLIAENKAYIEKWNDISNVNQSVKRIKPNGADIMRDGVGNLNFKFTND